MGCQDCSALPLREAGAGFQLASGSSGHHIPVSLGLSFPVGITELAWVTSMALPACAYAQRAR